MIVHFATDSHVVDNPHRLTVFVATWELDALRTALESIEPDNGEEAHVLRELMAALAPVRA